MQTLWSNDSSNGQGIDSPRDYRWKTPRRPCRPRQGRCSAASKRCSANHPSRIFKIFESSAPFTCCAPATSMSRRLPGRSDISTARPCAAYFAGGWDKVFGKSARPASAERKAPTPVIYAGEATAALMTRHCHGRPALRRWPTPAGSTDRVRMPRRTPPAEPSRPAPRQRKRYLAPIAPRPPCQRPTGSKVRPRLDHTAMT